ncbi:GNAT family N-acetyltransferase [Roseomonas sp. GC11]|uniref:GNAT family N-acetyltransferase n=1 Tax=Roseomonas sp. GC11 TaxID=2950546 RepID=UPI00210B5DEB|nr:GNAT family N-acetyltransferase [Roseomonas sp. GC11]MCQ4162021.1 GNAT family N-acetyltransferase [Roseomonas sp. GC11]
MQRSRPGHDRQLKKKIRRLSPEDASLFRALRLEALLAHPEAYGASHEEEAAQPDSWFADRLRNGVVLAGWRGEPEDAPKGEPEGIMGLAFPGSVKTRHKGLLWGVYLRPAARGTGLARALLEAVIAEARGRVEEIRLSVVVGNEAARRLYEQAGFTAWATEPCALKIGGTCYDETLMRLPLGSG